MKKLNSLLFVAFVMAVIWSIFIEPGLLLQNDQEFSWKGPNLKVAFFSDLHAGAPHISKDHIKDLVGRINAQRPDIILIGGDLVMNGVPGGKVMPIEEIVVLLKDLSAPLGTFVTLGNHDWWSDGENIRMVLEKNGLRVLENESIMLKYNEKVFWLIGIGDHFTNHTDAEKSFSKVYGDPARIIFMHDPAALFEIKNKYDLALAGHMHGGQIYIPGLGAPVTPGAAPKSWAKGWIDFPMGKLFVSRGIGTSILPIRFNAIPEYVILDLH